MLHLPPITPVRDLSAHPLRPGEVHLWCYRDLQRTSRKQLQLLLQHYLQRDEVPLLKNEDGKPYIAPKDNPQNLQFNLSHSREQTVFAFCLGMPTGVDVQWHDPTARIDDIVQRFFHKSEKSFFNHSGAKADHIEGITQNVVERSLGPAVKPQDDRVEFHCEPKHDLTENFYQLWTAKEALCKTMGGKLFPYLSKIHCEVNNGLRLVSVPEDWPQTWSLQTIPCAEDYTMTVACAGKLERILLSSNI